ncbi:MAG TPA: hypothetical protein PKD63_00385 [Solirubrobacteraceae bacterium]|nr:hypothetical protein [Solirubrobacteraceae bacterium]
MLALPSPQTVARPDRPTGEPERLGVTRLARDAAGVIARLRRLRRRRAVGELDEEAYRREAARLSSDPEPACGPDAES